jgi:rod shape-determining protein MreC
MLSFLFRHRTVSLFGMVVVTGLTLLTLSARSPGWRLPAEWVGSVAIPFQVAATHLHRRAVAAWDGYRDWRAVRGENQRLRQEVETLRVNQLLLQELEWENRRLRNLMGLAERLPLQTVAAEVIAREWNGWVRSFTVNRGRAHGLERLQPVIVPEGVLGRVAEVRHSSAIIQLISDPASFVSAVTQKSRVQGAVEGGPAGQVRFKFPLQDGEIEAGEIILTSGLGGVFPRGLPLGRVRRVNAPATGLFRYAQVEPAAEIPKAETVLVLRGPVDLSTLFSGKRE